VASAAEDVRAIADHLGIDRFAVVGRSGGGPHALAVAAELSDRVTATAVLGSFALLPPQVADRRGAMCPGNVETFAMVNDKPSLVANLTATASRTVADPEYFIKERISDSLSSLDYRVLENVVIRRQLKASFAEALRDGIAGWTDDLLALHRDWGFRLAEVKAPAFLWHGADDRFAPVENTYWLAEQLAHPEVEVDRDAGHFGAVEALPQVLAWIVNRHREAVGSLPDQ
jgi:pimeloyl-ACP methyl ester carboxylesterase